MMKNAKMNEKGKLLAIIAVFAMVFAGAAVVMSSEGVDATTSGPYAPDDVPATDALPAEITDTTKTAYYADGTVKETTLKITTGEALNVTVYVKSGVTVTFKGVADDKITVTVFGYYEDAAGAKKYNTATDGSDTNVAIAKPVANEAITVTPTTVAAKHTTMEISGEATATASLITITLGNATAPEGVDYGKAAVTVKGSLVLKATAAPTNLTYAYSLFKGTPQTIAIYEKPLKTYNHSVDADTDTGDVLTIAGYDGLTVTADIKVTSDKGATTFKLVETPLTKDLVVTMQKTTEPKIAGGTAAVVDDPETEEDESVPATVVTLFQGFATAKAAAEADGFKGTLNAVQKSGAATEYYAQLYYNATADPAVGPYTVVKGTVTQKGSVNLVAAAGAITVGENDTLIIPEGVTVTVNSDTESTLEGAVELYGALVDKATADSSIENVKIGPLGYTNFGITGTGTNVSSTGQQPELGGQIKEDTTIGDVIIKNGGLEILAGHTLTVTGDLGLNSEKLVVNGKLVVTGSVYSTAVDTELINVFAEINMIIIGPTGDIDIQGNMAVNTYVGISLDGDHDITVRAVDGLVYTAVEVDNATAPAISGVLTANTQANENVKPIVILKDNETMIPLPLKISSGVTLSLDNNATIVAGGLALIELEGTLEGIAAATNTLELTSLSSMVINGLIENVKIVAYEGTVSETGDDKPNTTFTFKPGKTASTGTGATLVHSKKTFVSGLTITVMPEIVSKTVTMQHVHIEGDLTATNTTVDAAADSTTVVQPELEVTGARLHVVEDEALTIPSASKLTLTLDQNTTIVVGGYIEKADTALNCKYIGGHYVIKTTGTDAKTTHYYEPLAKAIAVIDSVEGKTVDASVTVIDFDFTIKDGQKVTLVDGNSTMIKSNATVTFESNAIMTGTVDTVNGILKVMNGARVSEPLHYASVITTENQDVIYAGADGANALAQPGDRIVIGDGEAAGDYVFKDGVEYVLQGKLQIPGNAIVEDESEVVFEGGEIAFKGGKTHNLQVDGEMDATQGSFSKATANDKINATVTGTLAVINEDVIDALGFTGASYESANGFVMTTIDQAIPGAVAAAIDYTVKIHGNVVYVADITVEKVTIVFKTDATLNFAGTVTLDEATIDVTNGTFTGTVTADTVLLGSATAEFTAVKGTLKIADDTGLTLSGGITAGIVSLESGVTIFGDLTMGDALLMVGERATAHVHGETKITDGVFTIAGTVAADNGGSLELNGGVNMVAATGTLVAQKTATAGNVVIKTLTVYGTLKENGGTISVTENIGATTGLIIGAEPTSLGAANGTVIGNITAGTNIIMIYAGADFDEMKIGGATTYKATVFMINGVEYQIMASSNPTGIDDAVLAASDYDLPGYDGTAALKTKGGWDFGTTEPKVGTPALVTATLEKSTVDVTVSPIKGMSIVIDGVTYKNTVDAELKVGEHTLSFTLDPGYKIKDGSSVTMTFNGVKVTNAIIITPGMVGQDLILAASGEIVIDQEIPEQEKQDDTVIIILLAILVVMVVILAIVTILRMMRS